MEKFNSNVRQKVEMIGKAALISIGSFAATEAAAGERVYHYKSEAVTAPVGSESFNAEVNGVSAYVSMPNGVLFVGADGNPLAVVPAQPIEGTLPGAGFTEAGYVTDGYAKAWRESARTLAQVPEDTIQSGSVEEKYNWLEIKRAIENPAETMTPEDTRSVMDIVFYFGTKQTQGADVSRIEYVQDAITFADDVPAALQDSLKEVVVGIAAQESRFNDSVESVAGAKGIFQLMPSTVAGLGGYDEYLVYKIQTLTNAEGAEVEQPVLAGLKQIPLTVQVEMAGKHLSNIYRELYGIVSLGTLDAISSLYASEEDFQIYFLGPAIVNAYNTGSARMAEAIETFFTPVKLLALQNQFDANAKYDVFAELTDFARQADTGLLAKYGPDSEHYTPGVYGFAYTIVRDFKDEQRKRSDYSVANK